MRMFCKKTTKEQMLRSMAAARERMQSAPGSKAVMQMDDILRRFEAAYDDGREPSQDEIKGFFGEMIPVLENL